MASGVRRALDDVGLRGGDSQLISSGRTLYELAQQTLPRYPEIVVALTVFKRIDHMWNTAKAALLGVGAPPFLRALGRHFFRGTSVP